MAESHSRIIDVETGVEEGLARRVNSALELNFDRVGNESKMFWHDRGVDQTNSDLKKL